MEHLPVYNQYFNHLLTSYIIYLELTGYSITSCKRMHSCVKEFFFHMEQKGVFQLKEVTPSLIREHYRYLKERSNLRRPGKISLSHINYHLYAIKTFMAYQEKNGVITSNPFSVLSFPKAVCPQRQVVSHSGIKALYGACENHRDRVLISLFYGCGLRREEVVKLAVTDIRLDSLLLYVRSGKGRRRL